MRILAHKALASKVLAVLVERPYGGENGWTAYIDAIEGINHMEERDRVASNGTKLDEEVAKAVFPWKDGDYIW